MHQIGKKNITKSTKSTKITKKLSSKNKIKKWHKKTYKTRHSANKISKLVSRSCLKYEILSALDITKDEFARYFDIVRHTIPNTGIYGYIMLDKIKLFYNNRTYFVFRNGLFLGIVWFKNMTYDFKKSILGDYVDDKTFKSRANISNFVMDWVFIHSQMDKNLFTLIIYKFRKFAKLTFSNISILVMKTFDNLSSKEYLESVDILFRYRKFIDYIDSDEYRILTSCGLTYHGYSFTSENKLVNIYSMRFFKKLVADDFYPTYIISRQFKNTELINYTNLKNILDDRDFFTLKSYKKYSLDNTLVLSASNYYNENKSLNHSIPYEFNFITNFISNNLGNTHILTNYYLLYHLFIKKFGEKSKYSKYFCKAFYEYDKAIKELDSKKTLLIIFLRKNISDSFNVSYKFSSSINFKKFINEKTNIDDLVYARDMSFINKLYPLKNGELYDIEQRILITYINNKLKCYIKKNKEFILYNVYVSNLSKPGKANLDYTSNMNFNESFNSYALKPINIEKISNQIKTICKIICKIYAPHACINYNNLHGFIIINPVMRIIQDANDDTYPFVFRIEKNFDVFNMNMNIQENSEALYKLAIEPALFNYGLHQRNLSSNNEYELLDIDDI